MFNFNPVIFSFLNSFRGENHVSRIMNLYIEPDIRKAYTLPSTFYRSEAIFEQVKEQIFTKSWHYIGNADLIKKTGQVHPFTLLENMLDEPLVLTKDKDGTTHCLSNICTHRGNIMVHEPGEMRTLSCNYHGRCFRLDGTLRAMPGFEDVENFPAKSDHLPQLPLAQWGPMLFASLSGESTFEQVFSDMQKRLYWLPIDTLEYNLVGSKDYFVEANWALYCDNYLEGFHVAYVHPALNNALDMENYTYELFPYSNLQLGVANESEPRFDIPEGAQDYGENIYAYYWFVFPNLMFNFYPWGLSLNVIEPLNHKQTRVRFLNYKFRGVEFDQTVHNLDITEMEDEAVVQQVQKGIQSRLYKRGRFSPSMEQGVHHFHRLISEFVS